MTQKDINSIISHFKKSCIKSINEDEIKAACNTFFHDLKELLNIDIRSNNEKTSIHGGRADSIYNHLYFELKKYKLFDKSKGIEQAIYGRNNKDHGVFHYLINYSLEDCHDSSELFKQLLLNKVGICFDGDSFIFCRFKDSPNKEMDLYDEYKTKNYPLSIPHKLNVDFEISERFDFDNGIKRILLYIRSIQRKQLTAKELCETFASTTEISQNTIPYLYRLLNENIEINSRIRTLYNEWYRIFGTIYEKQVTDFVKHVSAISDVYHFESAESLDVEKALFVIQTYYSIIIKLLIQNLFHSLRLPLGKVSLINSKSDLVGMFYGAKDGFNLYISNFFEINFFEWFILAENVDYKILNDIVVHLDEFETTASVIKPELVSDVLKLTYESLMPRELRHLMGEYYTVEWLADFTIEKSGYSCKLNESVLDPTCGSGIFLTRLINKFHHQYYSGLDYNSYINHVINNFVGFDINPIAVIQAKGNYILSLGDVTRLTSPITIPIYMCDSILVPTVHAKQKENNDFVSIMTSVGDFKLPLLKSRVESDQFLNILSDSILSDYKTFEDFNGRLKTETGIELSEREQELSRSFFDQLLNLHLSGKDGFWPIILKNSFAPLFCKQKFDYVIGNPPWIAWKAMSDSYRNLTLDIWLSYGIFEKNAYDKKTSHDDFAMAVTYVVIDHYLKDKGCATLILPQTFVKSLKGGEGFRKFCITRDGKEIPFSVDCVYDMLKVNPFKGIATNKTSVYKFRKNKKMKYPMNCYYEYGIKEGSNIDIKMPYVIVKDLLYNNVLTARPINNNARSPWLTVNTETWNLINPFLGRSVYKNDARKGIEPCGAKGVYLITIKGYAQNFVKIENLIERSRLPEAKELGVHIDYVESDFVYPMVGGRNIEKWGINGNLYILVPHENNTGTKIQNGITESVLKQQYPKTYKWLYYFHDLLLSTRIRSGKFFDKDKHPWYRLDNVGPYTFSKYKVLWQEQAHEMKSCVVSTIFNEGLGDKVVLTDSKVLFLSLDNEEEAYYVCGILNSKIIETVIQNYTINTNRGIDIVNNIKIPKYSSRNTKHKDIVGYSKQAHAAYLQNDIETMKRCEDKINEIVPIVFVHKKSS